VFFCYYLDHLELPGHHLSYPSQNVEELNRGQGTHRGSAKISCFSHIDNIIEALHDLLYWRITVKATDLKDINVSAKSNNASVHRIHDMLPGQADSIDEGAVVGLLTDWVNRPSSLIDTMEDLGHDDN